MASTDVAGAAGDITWSRVRGAFMVGGQLFYGHPDATGAHALHRHAFDGTSYGPATVLAPYRDPFWSGISTGSGQTYQGSPSNFSSQLGAVTGMFFRDGRLYYTRANNQGLYSRGFSLDSGVVQADESVVATSGFGDVAGAYLSGDSLYTASRATGELRRVGSSGGAPTGPPVVVSGPGVDGRDWRARALFLGPGGPPPPPPPPNQAPTARATAACTGTACSFDGSGSSDADGTSTSSSWDFGDGATGTGATAQHVYTDEGTYSVQLTVTDDDGATGTTTTSVTVAPAPPPATITSHGVAATAARGVTSVSVTVPDSVQAGDGLVLVLSTNSAVTGTAPAGYRLAGQQAAGTVMTTQVFSRVAAAGDAGADVTVALSGTAKVTLQLVAYSGTTPGGPVTSLTGASDTGGTAHSTPSATAPAGSWVLSVWSDKSSAARQFTAPAGVVERSNAAGVGSGAVATLLADGGGPVTGGQVGGLTATVPVASSRATMLTVLLAPA